MAPPPPVKRDLQLDPKYDHYDHPYISPTPQHGHPGYTTEEQDAKVHQLRMMLESAGYKQNLDTLTMLRFLRARKFDVELSKTMFIESEKWRSEFGGGVENLVRTFEYKEKAQVFEYYPQYYHKTDKDGRPVYIEQIGKVDLNAMLKFTTEDRMLQNLVCEYEKMADPRLPACCRKFGVLLETSCTIMDLKGVGLSKASSVYGYIQKTSVISQNYYPERLGKLYIINAPWGFSAIWSFISKWLDPVTVAKIKILGGSYQGELLKQIPAESLPKEFGGSCECPGSCAMSDMGPWQDPQWTKPPKWAKASDESIDTQHAGGASGVPEGAGAPGAPPSAATDEYKAGAPAPAPA